MTRIAILFSKLITAVAVAVSLTSCNYSVDLGNSITGSGTVVSVDRKVGSFDKVQVSDGLDCEVFQTDGETSVTVEADDNLVNEIKTTVENGTLVIHCEYGNYINVASKKVIVRMPDISILETSSASHLSSGNILTGVNITLKSSTASSIKADVEADNIVLETSSGSNQTIRGKALKLNTDSSSGSHINAREIIANEIYSQSSSGSSTLVHPVLLLDAKASSGSSIHYSGDTKEVRKDISSGGDVSKE